MKSKMKDLSSDIRLINLTEKDLDKPVYRIFSMKRLVEMLINKELVMPKVNSWDDIYENFFLKSNFSIDGDEIIGLKEDSDLYYGQCWCFVEDSDAMWRIYSHDKQSVRIKTTLRKLFGTVNSVQNCGRIMDSGFGIMMDTFVGAVDYKSKEDLDDWKKNQIIEASNLMPNILDSLFIKRDNFKHESEVRVIYCAEESDSKIKADSTFPLVCFKINPFDLIEEIAFDPRADNSFFSDNKNYLINDLSFPENKITKSKLYELEQFTFVVT